MKYAMKLTLDDGITMICCPHCDEVLTLGHMNWSAIVCIYCKKEVYQ